MSLAHAQCPRCISSTTWELMASPQNTYPVRACVTCGIVCSGKNACLGEVTRLAQSSIEPNNPVDQFLLNVCKSSSAWHTKESCTEYSVHMCVSCHHWLHRRASKGKFIAPLSALHRFMRTLNVKLILDSRVIKRVVRGLCSTFHLNNGQVLMNGYWNTFSPDEQNTIAKLNAAEAGDARHIFAQHFITQNANTFLLSNKLQIEFLREHAVPRLARYNSTKELYTLDAYMKRVSQKTLHNSGERGENASETASSVNAA